MFCFSHKMFDTSKDFSKSIGVMGDAMAEAMQGRDLGLMQDIIRRAIQQGIPVESVMRSAKANTTKLRQDVVDRQFDDYPRSQVQRAFGVGRFAR